MDKNSNLAQQICEIHFALAIWAESVEDHSTAEFTKVVTFFSGYDWEQIEFTAGTAEFSENEDSLHTFKQQLNCFYPGDDADTIVDMEQLRGLKLLVKLVYGDGQTKLLGTKDNAAMLISNQNIGGKTGYSLRFTRNGERAYWLA